MCVVECVVWEGGGDVVGLGELGWMFELGYVCVRRREETVGGDHPGGRYPGTRPLVLWWSLGAR